MVMVSARELYWLELREALGLTQAEMAALLCISERQLRRIERGIYRRPPPASMLVLRARLRHPEMRRRLEAAGVQYPFPEDLQWP